MNKTNKAIELIQRAESLALKYQDYGFHLAFSGGKDSQVIYELCKMAGVKFRPVMQVTTLDPPELMRFVRVDTPELKGRLKNLSRYFVTLIIMVFN